MKFIFHQSYRSELNESKRLYKNYLENNYLVSYKEEWDIYHSFFRNISNNFANIVFLHLESRFYFIFSIKLKYLFYL